RVATRTRLGHLGEQFAQRREQPGVGGRVGTRRAPDRRLVDVHDLVEQVQAFDRAVRRGLVRGAVDLVGGQCVQRVVDQGRLARAGYAGDRGEQAGRDREVDVLQVIAAGAFDPQGELRVGAVAAGRHFDLA